MKDPVSSNDYLVFEAFAEKDPNTIKEDEVGLYSASVSLITGIEVLTWPYVVRDMVCSMEFTNPLYRFGVPLVLQHYLLTLRAYLIKRGSFAVKYLLKKYPEYEGAQLLDNPPSYSIQEVEALVKKVYQWNSEPRKAKRLEYIISMESVHREMDTKK